MTAPAFDAEEIHAALDELLKTADADGGRLDPAAYWKFNAMLGQGRGIAAGLHEAGIEEADKAAQALPPELETSGERHDRIRRAYHLALLRQLLIDMDAGGGASVLPANFDVGAICGDLSMMLGGKYGTGDGAPQILFSSWKGNHYVRRAARTRFVHGVIYEAAVRGCAPETLLSEFGARNLSIKTWRHWVDNTPNVQEAEAAGKAHADPERWAVLPERRAMLWSVVKPGSGLKK